MPDPAQLPVELFSSILENVIDRRKNTHPSPIVMRGVSHRWNQVSSRLFYQSYRYRKGDKAQSVWDFMRTIFTNPELASLVKTLDIRAWGCCDNHRDAKSTHLFEFMSADDEDFLQECLVKAGFGGLEAQALRFIANEDCAPIMALLAASMPNLRKLFVQVPKNDPFFGRLIKLAVGDKDSKSCTRPLQKLEKGCFAVQGDYDEYRRMCYKADNLLHFDIYHTPLKEMAPIFYLPRLKSLTLVSSLFANAKEILKFRPIESLTHLAVALDHRANPSDLRDILELTRNLTSLWINAPDWSNVPNPHETRHAIWESAAVRKDTLTELRIYEERQKELVEPAVTSRGQGCVWCCPLLSFHNLTTISISPEYLFAICDHEKQPFKLEKHLSSSLEALTLYPVGTPEKTSNNLWDKVVCVM
ncbi:hypothetical protein ASPWEDRAFT_43384 [Aspergillus wentii DTO 134E9]|uniref:F-box domain-containing protein n=1 Tax=Aspergillus wentii DTO 134E9 TaxID=1073089 RepID=A0A1L9REF7_ASPWE|nr:uncharacterized protein ASPWEDRAFT_43384 [Aspergillus wentii DTO 134E9]KAI9933556.1 hypothetical protein MW887_008029 [Aspergillus wentii]OJJ33306.1 hypothetical protein ASPWEDRAFT_43384 [Aspergillus wentii DTO 134E9]